MAYSPTELKKGVVIELDGKPFRVIEYNQKVVGRGGSIVNVKIKNLIDTLFFVVFVVRNTLCFYIKMIE